MKEWNGVRIGDAFQAHGSISYVVSFTYDKSRANYLYNGDNKVFIFKTCFSNIREYKSNFNIGKLGLLLLGIEC